MVTQGTLHTRDALAVQAQADALTAYMILAGEPSPPANNLRGQDLGGMTLTPGVYRFDSSAQLTGVLSLNNTGNPTGTFIFQIGSTLITASNSAVTLLGAADPNIFWQVGSSATLGTGTAFDGNILALASITLTTGANIPFGRALAINGAVTLDTNNVSASSPPSGRFWNGGANNLWSGMNWSPDATGATSSNLLSGTDVVFSVTGIQAHNEDTVLDVDETISSLTVNDPAAVTISGPHTLTITGTGVGSGITINSGAGLTTINSNLQLTGLSEGIKCYLISQDINQLKSRETGYGRDESITSNCHVQCAFPPNRLETAEHLSKLTGQTTIIKEQVTRSGRGFLATQVSTTMQEVQRPLLTPDECLRMPGPRKDEHDRIIEAGDMVVYCAGFPAIYGRQPLYFEDPTFAARAAIPPPKHSDPLSSLPAPDVQIRPPSSHNLTPEED